MGIKFVPRLSAARGHANQYVLNPSVNSANASSGWLLSYHTFSFANYFDPDVRCSFAWEAFLTAAQHMQFGPLRVINEDRVTPSEGFGKHSHREVNLNTIAEL